MKKMRKNWLIYPKFQLLLIAINSLVVTLSFALVAFGLHIFFKQLEQTGNDSGLSGNHYYFIFLGNQAARLYWIIGLSWFGSIIVTGVASLLLSHKIVGPIVRLRSYFREMRPETTPPQLSFRKGDFFSDLPEVINKAIQR